MAMWYVVCTFWPHRVRGPFDSRQDGEDAGEEEGCCILLKLEVDGRTLTAEEDAWV